MPATPSSANLAGATSPLSGLQRTQSMPPFISLPFLPSSPLQIKPSCSPQDREIRSPLYRDRPRRDQAPPAPHHRSTLLGRRLALALANPSWPFPCHLLPG